MRYVENTVAALFDFIPYIQAIERQAKGQDLHAARDNVISGRGRFL